MKQAIQMRRECRQHEPSSSHGRPEVPASSVLPPCDQAFGREPATVLTELVEKKGKKRQR
jgi:hypothetical protein